MATVIRRRALVNPAHKRKNKARRVLSPKQIRFFGTPAQKAALKRSRAAKRAAALRKSSAHRARTPKRRPNVSAIFTAGLPFTNPATRKAKRKSMAKSHTKTRPRRSTAHHKKARRKNSYRAKASTRRYKRHASRTRPNPSYRRSRRYYGRRMNSYKRRHNPKRSSTGLTGLVKKAAYVGVGAIGSRWLTQLVLGSSNVSWMGYGANAVATLLLGWGAGKFLGSEARNFMIVGGVVGILLRLAQDLTPWGKTLSLSGFGDSGVTGLGMYMQSSYVDPRIFSGQGAELRIPPAWKAPAIVPAKGGVGASTYGRGASTYSGR